MAHLNFENRVATFATKSLMARIWLRSTISVALCVGPAVCVLAQDAQQSGKNESWTVTSETSEKNVNPSRTSESHTQSGNRSVDKQRVEVLGPNGQYQPNFETETETIRLNDTTTRTVVRTYRWDGNGQRKLAQVTEEEARSTANGDVQAVKTTSSSDVNGNFRVVQREVADTKKISPDAQETKTTVYLGDSSGGFTTARQIQELQKRSGDHTLEAKKTTLVPDGNGNLKVSEIKEKTIQEDGKNRTTEERVSRSDLDGRLSEASRTVDHETETATGEKNHTVDSYDTNVPGYAGDGRLHLNQRVSTIQKKDANGETTEQQIEQINPGNPSDGRQLHGKVTYVVKYAASGSQQTKTTQTRDASGNMNVVSVETQKTEKAPPPPQTTSDQPH